MLDLNITSEHTDEVLKKTYQVGNVDALKLSQYLKTLYTERGIDTSLVDGGSDGDLPKAVYEYQNFFLLHIDGEYFLLDGFRRLLRNVPPKINIKVRIYEKEDFNDSELLSLMVDLNHFKFIGNSGGQYYERGFKLFLHAIIGVNIKGYEKLLNDWLNADEIERDYLATRTSTSYEETADSITSDYFVPGLQFLMKLKDEGYLTNTNVCALFRKILSETPDVDYDKLFQLMEDQPLLKELSVKVLNTTNTHGDKLTSQINSCIISYQNCFNLLEGKEVVKTYQEKLSEVKNLIKKLDKRKDLTKITKRWDYDLEQYVKGLPKENIDFMVVQYPNEEHPEYSYGEVEIPNLKIKYHEKEGYRGDPSHFYLENDEIKIEPETSYDNYHTSIKLYCASIGNKWGKGKKVVVYLKKDKSEWAKFKKEI